MCGFEEIVGKNNPLFKEKAMGSKLYENAVAKNDTAAIEFLRHISPVASQHLNIDGLYEFAESIGNISVDNVVEVMSRLLDDAMNPSLVATKKGK